MKRTWIAVTVALSMTCWVVCGEDPITETARPKLTLNQIKTHDLIGEMGIPLGQCVRVRATIVKGSRTKSDTGRYFLDVTHVESIPLEKPVQMTFRVHQFAEERVQVANDGFSLVELRTGEKPSRVSSDKIEEYEVGYVGKKVELLVYETGMFDGFPRGLKDSSWQGGGYQFFNWLMVMKQFNP